NRPLEASVTNVLGGLNAMLGDFERARSLQARAQGIYEDLGMRIRMVISSLLAADIEQFAGQSGDAVAILRRAYADAQEVGAVSVPATRSPSLADALSRDGQHGEAEELAKFSEEHAPASDIVTQVLWRTAKARGLWEQRSPEADELARYAAALARDTDYP